MNMMEILRQTGGVEAIARELGVPPAVAQAGAEALLPAVVGGFRKQAEAPATGGLGGLVDILGGLGGGALATSVLAPEPTDVSQGNDILGQIFGSKDVSRTVAGQAASQTGIDGALLKRMLPLVAMLVAGYLARQGGAAGAGQGEGAGGIGGMIGGVLGSVLGGGGAAAGGSAGGGLGGLGGLGSLLDLDGDGNPLDDIIGMAGKFAR